MSKTAQTLITDALKQLGAVNVGESLTDEEAQDALSALNTMLESWSLEPFYIFDIGTLSHTLTIDDGSYTIGSGGDIDEAWPTSIREAWLEDTSGTDTVRYELDVVDQAQFNAIIVPTTSSNIPDTLFYDPQYPLGVIKLYPVPTAALTLKLDVETQLQEFSALTTSFSYPPGYYRALQFNLALELAAPFGLEPSRHVERIAREATANIKRRNNARRPNIAVADAALLSRGGGARFNINRGR